MHDKQAQDWVPKDKSRAGYTTMGDIGAWGKKYLARNPLWTSIAGGLGGAGLGYLVGSPIMKAMLPKYLGAGNVDNSRVPMVSALLGGLAGAAPGLTWGYYNQFKDKQGLSGWTNDNIPMEKRNQLSSAIFAEDIGAPKIGIRTAINTIWGDPFLTPTQKLTSTAVVQNSAREAGRTSGFLTVSQVIKGATGLGLGILAGKVIGGILGLSLEKQFGMLGAAYNSGLIT